MTARNSTKLLLSFFASRIDIALPRLVNGIESKKFAGAVSAITQWTQSIQRFQYQLILNALPSRTTISDWLPQYFGYETIP